MASTEPGMGLFGLVKEKRLSSVRHCNKAFEVRVENVGFPRTIVEGLWLAALLGEHGWSVPLFIYLWVTCLIST